ALGRLRGRRGWWRASTVRSDQILRTNGPAWAKADLGRAGARPIRFGEDISRLREPTAVVVILENLRRVLATANQQHGAASERKTKLGVTTRQNRKPPNALSACPLERILRHHNGGPQASVGQR